MPPFGGSRVHVFSAGGPSPPPKNPPREAAKRPRRCRPSSCLTGLPNETKTHRGHRQNSSCGSRLVSLLAVSIETIATFGDSIKVKWRNHCHIGVGPENSGPRTVSLSSPILRNTHMGHGHRSPIYSPEGEPLSEHMFVTLTEGTELMCLKRSCLWKRVLLDSTSLFRGGTVDSYILQVELRSTSTNP